MEGSLTDSEARRILTFLARRAGYDSWSFSHDRSAQIKYVQFWAKDKFCKLVYRIDGYPFFVDADDDEIEVIEKMLKTKDYLVVHNCCHSSSFSSFRKRLFDSDDISLDALKIKSDLGA